MIIRVTQQNIDNGVRQQYDACPVALALRDATAREWQVTKNYAQYALGSLILALPETARDFIRSFDAGREVRPFEFDLLLEGKS